MKDSQFILEIALRPLMWITRGNSIVSAYSENKQRFCPVFNGLFLIWYSKR